MRRLSGGTRSKRLALVAIGGLLLVPTALAATSLHDVLPLSSSMPVAYAAPNGGDLLAAVRRLHAKPEDYGASGELPEADTLSPELLAALSGPAGTGLGTDAGALATVPPGPLGIPGIVLDAYLRAEQSEAARHPMCGVTWSVLAGIGRIESNHARNGAVDAQGTTVRPILGPQLSGGPGMAAIPDSDGGLLDGDAQWDRAVGPMQFIPTSWSRYAVDGNNDGVASPHNVYDAALASADYLCSGGDDLRDPVALAKAIFRYNHSDAYVANVLTWAAAYATGVTPLPAGALEPPSDVPVVLPPPTSEPPTSEPPTTTTTPTTTPTTTTTTPTCTTQPTTTTTTPSGTTTPTSTTTTPTLPPCETTTPPTTTDTSAGGTSTAGTTSAASSPAGSSPAGSSPAESSPAGTSSADTSTAGSSTAGSSTAGSSTSDASGTEAAPVTTTSLAPA